MVKESRKSDGLCDAVAQRKVAETLDGRGGKGDAARRVQRAGGTDPGGQDARPVNAAQKVGDQCRDRGDNDLWCAPRRCGAMLRTTGSGWIVS